LVNGSERAAGGAKLRAAKIFFRVRFQRFWAYQVQNRKNFSSAFPKDVVVFAHPASTRGAFRDRHGRGKRDAMDMRAAHDECSRMDDQAVWS
jgi:hypothetical protein